jgi:hypothetical protein
LGGTPGRGIGIEGRRAPRHALNNTRPPGLAKGLLF